MTFTPIFIGTILWGVIASGLVDNQIGCEENSVQLHPGSCRIFKKCINGRLVNRYCPVGEKFDPETNSCIFGSSCGGTTCSEGDIRPSATCKSYRVCKNGEWTEFFCPAFNTFNLEEKKCVWHTEYSCPMNINPCREGEIKHVSCRQYQTCSNGKLITVGCPIGEVFDEEAAKCVVGDCKRRSRRDVSSCEEGQKRRMEGECQKYTECINGTEVEKSCPDCMNFDDDTSSCRFVFKKACPSPAPPLPTEPTTAPPPTTQSSSTPSSSINPSPTTPTEPPTTPTEPPTTPTPPPTTQTEPPTTTIEPPTTTTEPPTTTIEPPTTTTEPPTTTTAPPTTTTAPPTTTTEPPTSTEPPTTSTTTTTPAPKCTDGEKRPVKEDCSRYQECKNGEFENRKCNWFRHFDSKSLECKLFGYTCA